MGIMHRDLKPGNLLIELDTNQPKVIDWGSGDFFIPGKINSPNVGTGFWRGPEQHLKYFYYDYSTDIWSLGAIFGGMLFKKKAFLKFNHDDHQESDHLNNLC